MHLWNDIVTSAVPLTQVTLWLSGSSYCLTFLYRFDSFSDAVKNCLDLVVSVEVYKSHSTATFPYYYSLLLILWVRGW
jgi:hypothetical protein